MQAPRLPIIYPWVGECLPPLKRLQQISLKLHDENLQKDQLRLFYISASVVFNPTVIGALNTYGEAYKEYTSVFNKNPSIDAEKKTAWGKAEEIINSVDRGKNEQNLDKIFKIVFGLEAVDDQGPIKKEPWFLALLGGVNTRHPLVLPQEWKTLIQVPVQKKTTLQKMLKAACQESETKKFKKIILTILTLPNQKGLQYGKLYKDCLEIIINKR